MKARGEGGGRSVKRAVSLPRELDGRVLRLSRATRRPYSAVIQVALKRFFERQQEAELVRAYQEYYGTPGRREKDGALATEMLDASMEGWPE